ncbi:peptide/nickel transport system permease protein [Kribbella aluminosa]|uniref:Peptide/nickel transport system permease protein n=1 Tax=Kribbella aluminosa TaxID=416017 RepID=A0ABS4UDD8_9ACTN|nr:ABC transporter permease [Kribbella aluminosa]MBP2349643.1 peptide/nickel transport system permease protein [Kribbella aluminosa]
MSTDRRAARAASTPSLIIGATLLTLFVGAGLLSLVWTPADPGEIDVAHRLAPPGTSGHLLGTDGLGRDVLSMILAGARTSLTVAGAATLAAVVPGVLLGLLIAGSRRTFQGFFSRVTDIGIALPGLLLALVLATAIGPGTTTSIVAIITWFVPVATRVTIGPARQVLALDFVEAALAYGRSRRFVLFRHVLPNIGPLVLAQTSVMFASAILLEAALSYLGVGTQPPTVSWGRMLNDAQHFIGLSTYLIIPPGLAIVTAVLGFNFLSDGLRAWLDPQSRTKAVAA